MKHVYLLLISFILPIISFAQIGEVPIGPNTKLPNPLGNDVNSLFDIVTIILNEIVLPIGAVVIVFFIIYSGFLFVTARGNESQLEKAKDIFKWVIVGSAILLGSVAISEAIKGTLCQIAPALIYCH